MPVGGTVKGGSAGSGVKSKLHFCSLSSMRGSYDTTVATGGRVSDGHVSDGRIRGLLKQSSLVSNMCCSLSGRMQHAIDPCGTAACHTMLHWIGFGSSNSAASGCCWTLTNEQHIHCQVVKLSG